MARRSGGRSAPRAAPRRPVQNPPQAATRAPPPAPAQAQSGSLMGSIGSTIAQGLAFGGGSAVAHRAVDSIMGPRTIQVEHGASEATTASSSAVGNAAGSDACNIHNQAFQDCINNYGSDISKCQFYLDMLSQCRKNSMLSA
ncbi:hypothetical protein ACHQM5_023635 [Ranunculus cassubicifolius]